MAKHRKQSQVGKTLRRALASTTVVAASGAGLTTVAIPAHAVDWTGIIACESGGNPHAVNNSPAGVRAGRPAGLYQIVTGTWLANGGGAFAPTADQATVEQQTIVANRIYANQGFAPWACSPGHANVHIQADAQVRSVPRPAPPAAAPVAPSAPAHLPGAGKYYVVKSGDSLYRICAEQEGNPNLWPTLYANNRAVVGGDANLIFPGQRLTL